MTSASRSSFKIVGGRYIPASSIEAFDDLSAQQTYCAGDKSCFSHDVVDASERFEIFRSTALGTALYMLRHHTLVKRYSSSQTGSNCNVEGTRCSNHIVYMQIYSIQNSFQLPILAFHATQFFIGFYSQALTKLSSSRQLTRSHSQ